MKINRENWKWTREPKDFTISEEKMEITECMWLAHDGQAPDEE